MEELSTTDCVLNGIALIRIYEPETELSAESGYVFFGSYDDTFKRMKRREQRQMKAWGWTNEHGAWACEVGTLL